MKRLVLFCSFMVLSLCMLAQINLNDGNWQCVLNEQFDEGDAYWNWDTKRFLNTGDYSWKSYLVTIIPKGEYEIYQFENCRINSADNTMQVDAIGPWWQRLSQHRWPVVFLGSDAVLQATLCEK